MRGKLDNLPNEERKLIEPVLSDYAQVFHHEQTNNFKGTDEHQMLLEDTRPIRKPQYRVPYALREDMKKLGRLSFAKRRDSREQAPLVHPRHTGPQKEPRWNPKFRFGFDFRALNSVTKFDTYPLPVYGERTSSLRGSKYYIVLDCYSGFWQINIKEEHKECTGF